MCIIPIVAGPSAHTSAEGPSNAQPRQCPNCHNNAMRAFKRRTWFELYWIPLIPFKAKHLLICTICQFALPNPDFDSSSSGAGDTKLPPQAATGANAGAGGGGYNVGYAEQDQGTHAKV